MPFFTSEQPKRYIVVHGPVNKGQKRVFRAAEYCCILYDKSNVWETNPLNVLYILLQILFFVNMSSQIGPYIVKQQFHPFFITMYTYLHIWFSNFVHICLFCCIAIPYLSFCHLPLYCFCAPGNIYVQIVDYYLLPNYKNHASIEMMCPLLPSSIFVSLVD